MELTGGSYDLGPVHDPKLAQLDARMDIVTRDGVCEVTFRDPLAESGPYAHIGDVHIQP